jgi:hypothetical protein
LLCFCLQGLEPLVPEPLEELAQAIEAAGIRAVETARPVAALAQQPRLAQHPQVLGDRRPRDVAEVRGDSARGQLAAVDQAENVPPARGSDGLDCALHESEFKQLLT